MRHPGGGHGYGNGRTAVNLGWQVGLPATLGVLRQLMGAPE